MHRFHSSMIPWQIYCPAVANTLKVFKSRKVASPSDVSQSYPIWAISDILIPSRYAAILHFYSFIFQDNEQSCACNKISLWHCQRQIHLSKWSEKIHLVDDYVLISVNTKFLNFLDWLLITLGRIYAPFRILKVSGIVKPESILEVPNKIYQHSPKI